VKTRTVIADESGKQLFIRIDGRVLTCEWVKTRFHSGEKVLVVKEGNGYVLRYVDQRLPFRETWAEWNG